MVNEINTTKVVKSDFQKGYEMLLPRDQRELRLKMMFECGWLTASTFYNKRKGVQPILKPEIPIIESIFSEYNLDPWTGENLT